MRSQLSKGFRLELFFSSGGSHDLRLSADVNRAKHLAEHLPHFAQQRAAHGLVLDRQRFCNSSSSSRWRLLSFVGVCTFTSQRGRRGHGRSAPARPCCEA